MIDTAVRVLTPPGTGAIATVALSGPGAWELVRQHFRPAKGELPESPPPHRVWFGSLGGAGGDEVVLAVKAVEPEVAVEVHCHGGRRVVRWVTELLGGTSADDARSASEAGFDDRALLPLTRATTLKTAGVLLDQYHGAFVRAVEAILADLPNSAPALSRLAALAPLGRHLVEPWQVVIAGPPNVGKSSLVNAVAGYQRSIVSPTAGTTRDVVSVGVALDGWPVTLSDTAGMRDAEEALEAEGIALAQRQGANADVVAWVMDTSDAHPQWAPVSLCGPKLLVVINKSDLPCKWDVNDRGDTWGMMLVSATTGESVPAFITAVVAKLVPYPPVPGEAVPFTPELADLVERASAALATGASHTARQLLRSCLPSG